ncbi:hypothetical protein NDN08_005568 [Rhodosorus marinus]|uniref:Trafficking protein particle complex subunit n=1 Tax=Rhodosorus marinus TaxID=101924 RepID=A0AAV8V2C2_9RHOD|nr:hypothetical protein NDN08_005568 [Rhodosorus marinus]
MTVLMIISPKNRPVFEAVIPANSLSERQLILSQLAIFAALDMVDEAMWSSKDLYLKVVDRFNDQSVSAFVTPGNHRFMLLHDARQDDGLKAFFNKLYEFFIKIALNPFYDDEEPIRSKAFSDRVRHLAQEYL